MCKKNCGFIEKMVIPLAKFLLGYFKFLCEGFIKYPFRSIASSILIICLFIYSLKLYAFEELYLIKASYFVQDDIVLKLWDAFFSFLYTLQGEIWRMCLLFLFIITYLTLPIFAIKNSLEQLKKEDGTGIWQKLYNYPELYIIVIATPFLWLIATSGFLSFRNNFINEIKIGYIHSNTKFCDVVNNGESDIIIAKPDIPYQLIFVESGIIYEKPNESKVFIKTYTESEISTMKELCSDK